MSLTKQFTKSLSSQGTIPTEVPWSTISTGVSSFLPQNQAYNGDAGAWAAGTDLVMDKGLEAFGPVGSAINVGRKLTTALTDSLGWGTDGMTVQDALLSTIPGVGALNGAFGKKTDSFDKDYQTLATVGSSYGGVNNSINKAMRLNNKKYGLLSLGSLGSANSAIHLAGRRQNILNGLAKTSNKNRSVVNSQMDLANADLQNTLGPVSIKNGAKLFSQEQLDRLTRIKNSDIYRSEYTFNTDAFADQPSVVFAKQGTKMNVIPEGSLHARKHELFNDNPELKGQITEKGIPVIVEKEGGEVEQQAEIELNEIIFIKSVTEKLEKYAKEYKEAEGSKKDEIAIKAGKLIAKQIMENTDDRTGLIEEI